MRLGASATTIKARTPLFYKAAGNVENERRLFCELELNAFFWIKSSAAAIRTTLCFLSYIVISFLCGRQQR
jgi:hypothetical protein